MINLEDVETIDDTLSNLGEALALIPDATQREEALENLRTLRSLIGLEEE